MAVTQKNFVVKNGIEIATDLIYATNDSDKVGFGTTLPTSKVDVIGGLTAYGTIKADGGPIVSTHNISGSSANFSGIGTIINGFNVGTGGTALKVIVGSSSSIGINTSLPAYPLDVYSTASIGQTAAHLYGDLIVTGNITGNSFDGQVTVGGTLSFTDLTVTGILTASDKEVYTQFDIINNGSAAYQYQSTGIGFTVNRDDPAIYLIRGKNYRFNVNAVGYPFYIKTTQTTGTTDRFDRGVQNNGAQVGIITFKVPFDAPSTLYYQASNQAGMGSTIYILKESEPLPAGITTEQITVQRLDVTGIATVADFSNLNTTGNLSVSGVSTFTGNIISNSDIIVESAMTLNSTGINIPTGIITASSFVGNLSGIASTATNANNINISAITSADTTTSLVLVANQSTGNQSPFIDSGISYNANTNTLSATTFSGSLSGTATTATDASNINISATSSTDTTTSLVLVANQSTGNQSPFIDSGLSYNANTNELSTNTFSGALNGNASTATILQTARTINGVSFNGSANITVEPYIEDDESTNATRYLIFTDDSTAGYKRLNEDSTLTYNPSTGTLSTTNFNSTSDISLKKDIEVITDATSILKQINGVRFTWKENDNKSLGVIAQEIEKVLPELVGQSDSGTKNVNYNGLIGLLIESVKELSARVEQLELKL